jgi:hypothetical protein
MDVRTAQPKVLPIIADAPWPHAHVRVLARHRVASQVQAQISKANHRAGGKDQRRRRRQKCHGNEILRSDRC